MAVIIEDKNDLTIELDCSSSPNYPASSINDQIKVTVSGKIGGVSGPEVEAGDVVKCTVTNAGGTHSAVGIYFVILQKNISAATESNAGYIAIASDAETDAETDDTKAITPLKLKRRIDAAKAYADSLVVGLLQLIGGYDPTATSLFPTTGGSGAAGAILTGDAWYVTVAGTMNGTAVSIGDVFFAEQNTPGQTHWAVLKYEFGYLPLNPANNLSDVSDKLQSLKNLGTAYNEDVAKSADYTIQLTDRGKVFQITTGASNKTMTLHAATLVNGFSVLIRKADTGAGKVLTSPATQGLGKQGHTVLIWSDGVSYFSRAFYGAFDASGNLTISSSGDINLNPDGSLKRSGFGVYDQSGVASYAAASGTDTYTVTLAPALPSYQTGASYDINFTNTNTGASTININGLGAKDIKDQSGNALSAGVLVGICNLKYNGTYFQFRVSSASSGSGANFFGAFSQL